MNKDTMFTFLDAWMSAMEGRSPSEAIERQEKRGQEEVVRKQRLPKKVNDHNVPNEIFFAGASNDMSWEDRKAITDQNLINYTREQYEKIGIEIIDEHDDLFWNVKLPEGWEVKATDHAMWNEVRDNKGRKRASFFYKAAFYDRDAFIRFDTRYSVDATHVGDPEDYEAWRMSDIIGLVKDGDTIIYSTHAVPATDDYAKDDKIKKELYDLAEAFLKSTYPDYESIYAYWD